MSGLVLDATGLAPDSRTRQVHSYFRTALSALLVFAGYYLGALIAYKLRFPSLNISVIWPPSAVLLVALLLTPARTWWVWLLAAFAAQFVGATQHGTPVATFVIHYVGNAIEAVIAAFGVRRFSDSPHRFDNLRSMAVFIGFAGIIAPGAASFLVAYLLTLSGWPVDYWFVWLVRSLGNAFPNLVLAPLLLLTVAGGIVTVRWRPLRYAEFSFVLVGLLAVAIPVFGWTVPGPGSSPALLYAPLPLLLWAAVRFGPAGACLSLLLVALLSLSNAIAGRGPFVTQLPAENAIALQFFLLAISLPLMFLTTLIEERRSKEEALRRNETALRASYRQVQDLAGRLIAAQEAERSRIASDLHDDVNQQLAGLSIALGNVKRQLQSGANGTVQEEITRLQQRTVDLADVIRNLSHELHPGVLQHAGLVAALRGHCAEFCTQHAIEVTLSAPDGLDIIPHDVALCLYRVVQEALRNIAEHSGAHGAQVTMRSTEGILELIIADDGQGFDLAKARGAGGLGLISLDERVRLVGGSLAISTQPQHGTELRVQVPWGGNQ
jgi:signal transduction histidine kinase